MERGKEESVAWLNHLNHRLSQHNSRGKTGNLKCVTLVTTTPGLLIGINRGKELNGHNFVFPEKERKERIHKQMYLLYIINLLKFPLHAKPLCSRIQPLTA